MPKGRGGQFAAQIAFSPDGLYLFLTVGDRQRMTPAQDPNQALGKSTNRSAARHGSGQDRARRQHLRVHRAERGAVGDLDQRSSDALTVWLSHQTGGCGKWSGPRGGDELTRSSLTGTKRTLNRIPFDGKGGARPAERWDVGHRIRDVEVGPDGVLWMVEDANPGGLFRVTPSHP